MKKKEMIIGEVKDIEEEDDSEYYREEIYRYDLNMFEGIPYLFHGITDELDHLSKLIEVIGESVISQEKEFEKISKEENDTENSFISDKIIDNWYKKTYRTFSYKALLTVIQGFFERGLTDLHRILKESKRITSEIKNDRLLDILREFKGLDPTMEQHILQVRPFNFIRNKMLHSDGYFRLTDKGYEEFRKFLKDRIDVEVIELTSPKGSFTHKMIIKQSTLLKDYIKLIDEILQSLVRAARDAGYLEPTTT